VTPDQPESTGVAPLVSCDDVSLRYGRTTIIENVNLTARPAEITTIIGPNGAGKTTLLKVLLGLIQPSSGHVQRPDNLRVGYVPQRLHLDPVLPITVSRLMTLTVRRPQERVEQALAETGVAHLIDAAVQSVSGGELQRVLLARALLVNPNLLVLDEPVQGVDFAGEAAMYELISALRRRRGCGIIMVSHDLHVVMAATDHVVCLNRHVCCAGTAETVSQHPEYVRLFGAKAAQSVAIYAHHHDHAHTSSGDVIPLEHKGLADEPGTQSPRMTP